MTRRQCMTVLAVMLAVGAAVRVTNAMTFPSLRAFDGFGHFTYIWFMASEWHVPLATAGWSFFHPPLYYAFMAAFWDLLAPLDPVLRLTVGTTVVALLGLTQALVAYAITRWYFPSRHLVHLLAAGLMLFLPAHLYSAAFLGNESFNAVWCAASLGTLVWTLRRPSWRRGLCVGLCLGAAMLTKFTSMAVVAGALGTLALQTIVHRDWRRGLATVAVTCAALLVVCGWYYARNVRIYGTPFKLSRDEFMVRHVEDFQSHGRRTFWEYVLFDPVVLRRPQWPRGIPLYGDLPAGFTHSALRESVLTGVYANAWFDAVGGITLPPVTESDAARHAGQLLLTLGLVPSLLAVAGFVIAVRRLWRGWDDTLVAMLLTFVAMVGLFVQATRTVPMHAAVKTTYLTPISVVFAFWLALGADALGDRWLRRVALVCALLATVSVVTFTNGVFIARGWLKTTSAKSETWQNLYGIVYYAGGDRGHARELFQAASNAGWHLGDENLAALAYDDGRYLEALYYVRRAASRQPHQSFGTPEGRSRFDRAEQSEYANKMAVIYARLGWLDAARAAARSSVSLDDSIPEGNYDLAVLTLLRAEALDSSRDAPLHRAFIAQSRALALAALAADPDFVAARELSASIDALDGDCGAAVHAIRSASTPARDGRRYPVITGPGDMHTAGIRRRMFIEDLPDNLRLQHWMERCSAQVAEW